MPILAGRVWEQFGDSLREIRISHLLLEEVKLGNDNPFELMEEFTQDSLPVGWEWIDPKGDCSYRMLNPGIEINVPPGRLGIDEPYLLIETSGDFILETFLQSGSQEKRSGGLVIWKDKDSLVGLIVSSIIGYITNAVIHTATVNGNLIFAGTHNYMEDKAWLRLERRDHRFTGYVSSDGENWYCCGYIDSQMDDPIHVGLLSICSNPPATSTKFEYFKIYRPK